ncbi:MAG: carboxypeptidase M32 [Gemmatimonadales bacterium]
MRTDQAYDELIRRVREEATLASIEALLEWDEETRMPAGAVEGRSEQLALVAGLLHERGTDPRIGELLEELEGSSLLADPDATHAVNVRELRRDYDRYVRLPRALVQDLARTTAVAQRAWADAREAADFSRFRPYLERIVELKRAEARCVGYEREPYDALIDDYEPGITSAIVGRLFDALRRELVPLAAQIAEASPRPDVATLRRPVALEGQHKFGERIARAVGFDFARGRLDLGVHPCCSSLGPGDCRIGLRYDLRDFAGGVLTVLHEVGHGLYEQGLDPEHYGTAMGEAASVGMDESQARLWENRVGRSRGFWEHFLPVARERFPEALGDVELAEFHFAVNRVTPSLIRVHADEVTYNVHVMIRFELERALMSGDLAAAELPGAWGDSYRQYLGITPANDAEGCLQDGHWADGLFGYFPTYTLGDVFGAQLFARAEEELGELEGRFAQGEFHELVHWLDERIYHQGARYPSARLIEVVTGSPPDHRPLVEALRSRYAALYDL